MGWGVVTILQWLECNVPGHIGTLVTLFQWLELNIPGRLVTLRSLRPSQLDLSVKLIFPMLLSNLEA